MKLCENGASHGDCATCGDSGRDSKMSMLVSGGDAIEDWVRSGGAAETKLIMRARRFSKVASAPLFGCGAEYSRRAGSVASRRATRSAICRAWSSVLLT